MVGQAAGMKEQKKTFSDLCAEFIGKPYSEYGKGPESFGCLGFCYAFLKAAGKNVIESEWNYRGFNVDNFMEAWKADPEGMERILLDGAEGIGTTVNVKKKLAGDFLILRARTGSYFPGIYAGNGHFMASYADIGVRVFGIDNKGVTVVKARRL